MRVIHGSRIDADGESPGFFFFSLFYLFFFFSSIPPVIRVDESHPGFATPQFWINKERSCDVLEGRLQMLKPRLVATAFAYTYHRLPYFRGVAAGVTMVHCYSDLSVTGCARARWRNIFNGGRLRCPGVVSTVFADLRHRIVSTCCLAHYFTSPSLFFSHPLPFPFPSLHIHFSVNIPIPRLQGALLASISSPLLSPPLSRSFNCSALENFIQNLRTAA